MADPADDWAREQAPRLVEEARAEALQQARRQLTAQLVDALLAAARRPEPPAAPAADEGEGEGVWLYGVTGANIPELPELRGVDPRHPVELIAHGELAALASAVPLAEFGAEALPRALEDLGRLEALSRAHEQVLDAALARTAVVPFRLCTIYDGAAHVRAMLEREHATLAVALARLEGMAEWGVKGFARRGRAAAPVAVPASGTEYVARKRDRRAAAEEAREATDAAVVAIHAQLSEQAADAVLSRPQDRRLSGHEDEMVLNAAYLVPDARLDEFKALVDALSRRHEPDGLALELTGPWPAYHFVDAS